MTLAEIRQAFVDHGFTPVPAHGRLFLNNRNQMFALSVDGK